MRTRVKTCHIDWDLPKLRKVNEGYSNPLGRAVLDAAAASPGDLVSFRSMCQTLGCSAARLRGALRSLSVFINQEFGVTGKWYNWPAAETVIANLTYYVMEPNVAAIWNGLPR